VYYPDADKNKDRKCGKRIPLVVPRNRRKNCMSSTRSDSQTTRGFLGILCVVLGIVSFIYWAKGMMYLAVRSATPNDLRLRWVDERYVFAGRNPYDTFFVTNPNIRSPGPMWNPRPTSPLPGIGPPLNAGYPPWAFFAGAIFYWPNWPAVRWYFAIINLLAGGLIFAWAYGLGRSHGKLAALALALGCTACSAEATTLGLGQYGIVITALLAASLWLCVRRRGAGSGLMLGLALAKPIIAGPFCVPMLFRREWKVIGLLAAYLVVADAVIWAVTKTNPVEMLLQMLRAGQGYMTDAYGPMNALIGMGMSQQHALAVTAVVVFSIGAILMWRWVEAPLLVHFAIASVAGRLWTYHKLYDNVMLVFLLVAAGELAFRSRRPACFAVFLLIGLTLWAPGKACDHLSFQIFQVLMWIAGMAFILACTPRRLTPNPQ
jgi:hypothetical protein